MKSKSLVAVIFSLFFFAGACKKNQAFKELPGAGIQPVTAALTSPVIAGIWTRIADAAMAGRYHAFSFSINNKGFVGGGSNADFLFPVYDFWSYDPSADLWTQKADVPDGPRVGAAAFAIGEKGYISTGFTMSDPHMIFGNKSDTWMYDAGSNTWTRKADFPGISRGGAVGISINNRGYVGTGAHHNVYPIGDDVFKDWWEYDPATNRWNRKKDFPGTARCYAIGSPLLATSLGCLGFGCSGVISAAANFNDWYQYDAAADSWYYKGITPLAVRNSAVAMPLSKFIYAGTGSTEAPYGRGTATAKKDMWVYNASTNVWKPIANLPAARSGATGFSLGALIYVGTGFSPEFYTLLP